MAKKVNQTICIKCGSCATSCPQKAITITSKGAVIDPKKCINCGKCVKYCPVNAIK